MSAPRQVEALGPTGQRVGQRLSALRRERDLTLAQLADKLSGLGRPMAVSALSNVENGQRRVDSDDLVALALALDVSPNTLLLPKHANSDDETALTSKRAMDAASAWSWARRDNPAGPGASDWDPLAEHGRLDELRARADAADRLAELLAEHGRVDELRLRADAGDVYASNRLIGLLVERGATDELRARAEAGDPNAVLPLADLLIGHGELEEATALLRGPADAGDQYARHRLTSLLVERGATDELRARAEAGDQNAAFRLADLLIESGDVDGAAALLRARADAKEGSETSPPTKPETDLAAVRALLQRLAASQTHGTLPYLHDDPPLLHALLNQLSTRPRLGRRRGQPWDPARITDWLLLDQDELLGGVTRRGGVSIDLEPMGLGGTDQHRLVLLAHLRAAGGVSTSGDLARAFLIFIPKNGQLPEITNPGSSDP